VEGAGGLSERGDSVGRTHLRSYAKWREAERIWVVQQRRFRRDPSVITRINQSNARELKII